MATWGGNLVTEGGGFCSIASPKEGMDLSDYDGLYLRVRGNGETLKVNVKTSDQVGPWPRAASPVAWRTQTNQGFALQC